MPLRGGSWASVCHNWSGGWRIWNARESVQTGVRVVFANCSWRRTWKMFVDTHCSDQMREIRERFVDTHLRAPILCVRLRREERFEEGG